MKKEYFLLIDLTTRWHWIALADREKLLLVRRWHHQLLHPKDLLSEIDKLLKTKSLAPKNLAGIIINRGPGGFTSLRNAAALVNSFTLVLKTRWAAPSRFEVLAQIANLKEGLILIPSGIGDFFAAEIAQGKIKGKSLVLRKEELRNLPANKRIIALKGAPLIPRKGMESLPENKERELKALLVLGQTKLARGRKPLTPLYGRPAKITFPKAS